MKYINRLTIALLLLSLSSCATNRRPQSLKDDTVFTKKLEEIRVKFNLPAIAAIIVNNKDVINIGATGVRAIESDELVTLDDKFHLGSNTKSMTATILGKLIEQGHFSWDDTLEKVFPNIEIHKYLKTVTLEQLLRHQGGVTGNFMNSYPKMWRKFWEMQSISSTSQLEQRVMLTKRVLKDRPAYKIGDKSNYSNSGITIVGHAIEKKMNDIYENLLSKMLFSELKMNSCGFGSPDPKGKLDHPRGHIINQNKIISIPAGPLADNPDAIAPAGKVHCSILDWGKYIQEHLKGSRAESNYLAESTFKKLHSPLGKGEFGLGWINLKPKWNSSDNHYFHNGSNSMNYAEMWISKNKNYAVAVVTNIGSREARTAVRDAVSMIAKDYLKN